MCRYFSGFFMDHPLLLGFDYYWRLDTDVSYTCLMDDDPFQTMVDLNKTYGWNLLMKDVRGVERDGWLFGGEWHRDPLRGAFS